MSYDDRTEFARLMKAQSRVSTIGMFAGMYLSMELVTRHRAFKGMAIGWKLVSWWAVAYSFKTAFNAYNAHTYGPIVGAYLRKYGNHGASDPLEITDRKREFFQIDTRQYMSYTHADLPHGHTNYGPQPDGEAEDASWLTTLDKFLSGEENHGL